MEDLYLNDLMLSKHPLPQLSDEHLTLLSSSHEQQPHTDSVYLDDFDLKCLDAQVCEESVSSNHTNEQSLFNCQFYAEQFGQASQFVSASSPDGSPNGGFHATFGDLPNCAAVKNSPTYSEASSYPAEQAVASQAVAVDHNLHFSSSIYLNDGSNELSDFNKFEFDDLTVHTIDGGLGEVANLNEIDLNEISSFSDLDSNQSLYLSPDAYGANRTSAGYLNQIINSPIDELSPFSLNQNSNSPSSVDFSPPAVHSPPDYSIQSVSSTADYYSIQSVNSNYSQSNSPLSAGSTSVDSSPVSYETHDYNHDNYLNYSSYSTYSNYSNNSNYSSYSNSFSQPNCIAQPAGAAQSKRPAEPKKPQPVAAKRKPRSKKAISEAEIKRKLEAKLERRRRRLERKKVQNKEAAARYRKKKKMEEDQINRRLLNVKDQYQQMLAQIKDVLNEKKVLVKLLKDFSEQSTDVVLPAWMQADFSDCLI